MSPEYAMLGQFSEKSDVFSFGIIVLEIITSKKNARSYESHNMEEGLMTYVSFSNFFTHDKFHQIPDFFLYPCKLILYFFIRKFEYKETFHNVTILILILQPYSYFKKYN